MKRRWAAVALASLAVVSGCTTTNEPAPKASSAPPPRILVFTRTAAFKHPSIPAAAAGVEAALKVKAVVVTTNDPAEFTDDRLGPYDAVVFLMTTGDVLDSTQQAAFERFISKGGGFAGVHSATDTEYSWAWYQSLIGATFKTHPPVQRGTVRIADAGHPSMRGLPSPWTRDDEWYDFRTNPRPNVHVLATVEEASYKGGKMGADHPIAWCRAAAGGHVWYTAMGHDASSWKDPAFLRHVAGGILSVAGEPVSGC